MPTSTELSIAPMERLKEFAQNVGVISWDDPDQIEPQIRNLCAPLEREPDVLMRAIREGVPSAVKRQWEREPDQPSEYNIKLISRHLCKRIDIDRDESMWAVRTIAVATGYIPLLSPSAASPASTVRADAPQGFSFQSAQPGTDQSYGQRLTEIEKKELASARAQAGFIELPGAGADSSGNYSGPINTNRLYPGPINTTLPSELNQQAGSYPGPINTTLPSEAAARPYPAPINLTLPQDVRAAQQRNNPYAQQLNPYAPPAPYGQPGGVAPTGSWPPAPSLAGQRPAEYWPESIIPEEVDENKWCWSGFLGGIWWMWAHGMRVGLPIWCLLFFLTNYAGLWWVRPVFYVGLNVFLGLRGNALAWQYRSFTSKEQFRAVQKAWVIFGIFWNLLQIAAMVWFFVALFTVLHAMAGR